MQKREAQCLLGNGICPSECKLYKDALEITNKLGDNFDPAESRRRIVFADAYDQNVRVAQIADMIARCATEPKPQEKQPVR